MGQREVARRAPNGKRPAADRGRAGALALKTDRTVDADGVDLRWAPAAHVLAGPPARSHAGVDMSIVRTEPARRFAGDGGSVHADFSEHGDRETPPTSRARRLLRRITTSIEAPRLQEEHPPGTLNDSAIALAS